MLRKPIEREERVGTLPLPLRGRRLCRGLSRLVFAFLILVLAVLAGCSRSREAASGPDLHGSATAEAAATRVARTALGAVGYRVVGRGPVLVMIMGLAGSMDAWDPPLVDALARRHTVLLLDNAGVGRTANPFGGSLTITDMARQTAALLDSLGVKRADVLGWSMGGMIAQALAVTRPSLVSHLVLCATIPGNGKATAPKASALSNLAATLFPPDRPDLEQGYLARLAKAYHPLYIASPEVVDLQRFAVAGWFLGREPAGREISRISVPTLIADGDEDPLIPLQNDQELLTAIPHSTLVVYHHAAHGFLIQYESVFVPRLESFLSGKARFGQ